MGSGRRARASRCSAALLAAWALVTIPFSSDPGTSLLFYRRFYVFAAIWVVAAAADSERRRLLLLAGALFGAAAIALYGEFRLVLETGTLFGARFGAMSNPMTSGSLLMMMALLGGGFLLAGGHGRRLRAVVGAALVPVLLGSLLTMTRSVMLGLLGGLAVMLLLAHRRWFLAFGAAAVIGLTVLFTLGHTFLPAAYERRLSWDYQVSGANTQVRLEMWQGGWEMVKARPWTGWGDRDLTALGPDHYGAPRHRLPRAPAQQLRADGGDLGDSGAAAGPGLPGRAAGAAAAPLARPEAGRRRAAPAARLGAGSLRHVDRVLSGRAHRMVCWGRRVDAHLPGVPGLCAGAVAGCTHRGDEVNILYFHQHFTTPRGTTGTRSYEMARRLVERGHTVTMVCGSNTAGHTGVDDEPIQGLRRGTVDGIGVVEICIPYSNHDGLFKRAAKFLQFALKSVAVARRSDYDLLFATSTPLTAAIPGIVMGMLKPGRPFVFEVRDLWPELPRAMGMKNPFILGGMSLLEKLSYRAMRGGVALSPGITDGMRRRSPARTPIELVPNGCDLDLFRPADAAFAPEHCPPASRARGCAACSPAPTAWPTGSMRCWMRPRYCCSGVDGTSTWCSWATGS